MRYLRRKTRDARKYRDVTDAMLVDAMRQDDRWAWAEFFARFYPPLEEYARRARIPRREWPVCILEVLDDAALTFTRDGAVLPRSLMHYLVVSVRHRFLNVRRADRNRQARYDAASSDPEANAEPVVRSLCSEDALRASRGQFHDPDPLPRGLRRLALTLAGGLTEQEWDLLSYLGERVPMTTISDWLSLNYETVAKRSTRLKQRLRSAAREHVATFPKDEQEEIQRFFARVHERKPRGSRGMGSTGGDAA